MGSTMGARACRDRVSCPFIGTDVPRSCRLRFLYLMCCCCSFFPFSFHLVLPSPRHASNPNATPFAGTASTAEGSASLTRMALRRRYGSNTVVLCIVVQEAGERGTDDR